MMQQTTHLHGKRKKAKKHIQSVSMDLLGFQQPDYQQPLAQQPRRRPTRKAQPLSHAQRQKRKFNFRTKFRFLLDADLVSESELSHFDGTSWKDWTCVQQVIITVSERHPVVCPVCLEGQSEMTAPNITFCGHVFCWPCILMHFERSNRSDQCPICNEWVSRDDLRSCRIISRPAIQKSQHITLVHRLREPHQSLIYHPSTLQQDFNFSRFVRADKPHMLERFAEERMQLEKYEKEYRSQGMTEQLPFIREAQALSEKRLGQVTNGGHRKEEGGVKREGMYCHKLAAEQMVIHIYQEEYGRMAFLHPICNKFLTNSLVKEFPLRIDEAVISKQQITLDERNLRRYKHLNHLPQNHEVTFIEIDMKKFLNEENYTAFMNEMGKHKSKIAEKEEIQQKKIEEANVKHMARRVKQRKENNMDVWSDRVEQIDEQLESLKNCNPDQHFPALQSSLSFVQQLSSCSSVNQKSTKGGGERETPKHLPETAQDDFPDLKQPQQPKPHHRKKKKKNKSQRVDITSMLFENDTQEF